MKKYRLSVDPRILELLGPNLYTSIYYVFPDNKAHLGALVAIRGT